MLIARLPRIFKINMVLINRGLDEIVLKIPFLRPVHFLFHLMPWNWFGRKKLPLAVRIRLGLEDLGPIFVKFGQMLSTRPDLLPEDVITELSKLQDKVPPFPDQVARQIIERRLGDRVENIFRQFDTAPLASASVAQVHAAVLKNGESVVIKVLRPAVHKVIRRDIELLHTMAQTVEKYFPQSHRLHPVDVVAEYEKTLMNEVDLLREAANASQLRRNFDNSPVLYIPKIYWDYCHNDVIVMERIYGIPVNDMAQLKAAGINLKKLAETGVEIFFTQVFRDNFFHADMHPGNIMVSPESPDSPQYLGVDFGIVGTLDSEDQHYLAANFLAFFNHDYRQVARLHIRSGWVPADTREDELEAAVRTVCEPIFQQPLSHISFGLLLLRLIKVARQFSMEVQPQLVLLQKTLLNIEGLGRQIYPQLDLWDTAKPFLERWMAQRRDPKVLVKKLVRRLPEAIEQFVNPKGPFPLSQQSVQQADKYKRDIAKLRGEVVILRRVVIALIFAAAFGLGIAYLYG